MSGGAVRVVLAAGTSSRMGCQKLLLPFRGATLLDAVLAACAGEPTIVVASPEVAPRVPPAPQRTVVVNDRPSLGMTHSLQLADAAAPAGRPLAVLLGDKPLLRAALIDVVAAHVGDGIDLAYPVGNDGVPGHPVVFGVRARARIASLPPGDTLKLLRDDPTLVAAKVAVDDAGAFVDIDSEADYRRLLDDRGGLSR